MLSFILRQIKLILKLLISEEAKGKLKKVLIGASTRFKNVIVKNKKITLISAGVTALLIIGGYFLYSLLKPPIVKKPQFPDFGKAKVTYKVLVSLEEKDLESLPQKLPVYSLKKQSFSSEQAEKLAQNLGFNITDKIETERKDYLHWQNSSQDLSVDQSSGTATFTKGNFGLLPPPFTPTINKMLEATKTLLSPPGLFYSDLEFSKEINFFSSFANNAISVGSANEAQLAQLSLERKIGDFSLFTLHPKVPIASFWFNGKGEVIKLEYSYPRAAKKSPAYPIKNLNEITQNLSEKESFIVSLGEEIEYSGKPVSYYLGLISKINVNQVKIAYFYSPQTTNVIQPIFIFSGEATIENKIYPTTLYLPALKEEYYQ